MILKREQVIGTNKEDLWLRLENDFGAQLNFSVSTFSAAPLKEWTVWVKATFDPTKYLIWRPFVVLFVDEGDAAQFYLAWGNK